MVVVDVKGFLLIGEAGSHASIVENSKIVHATLEENLKAPLFNYKFPESFILRWACLNVTDVDGK